MTQPSWPASRHEHVWIDTGKEGHHCTPFPVRYVRCARCEQNGYRIRPPLPPKSPDIVYTWCGDDPPDDEATDGVKR
jgi:hypothetical protein